MKLNGYLNRGGVSYEARRSSYRGSVTINGVRFRTSYYETKRRAQLALSRFKKRIVETLTNTSNNS